MNTEEQKHTSTPDQLKMIAQFMGGKKTGCFTGLKSGGVATQYSVKITDRITAVYYDKPGAWTDFERLQFDSSWDWLMPVVEKIEILNNGRHHFYIVQNESDIAFDTKYNEDGSDIDAPSFSIKSETKIQAAFQTVVAFIQWYNTQHPTNKSKHETDHN